MTAGTVAGGCEVTEKGGRRGGLKQEVTETDVANASQVPLNLCESGKPSLELAIYRSPLD